MRETFCMIFCLHCFCNGMVYGVFCSFIVCKSHFGWQWLQSLANTYIPSYFNYTMRYGFSSTIWAFVYLETQYYLCMIAFLLFFAVPLFRTIEFVEWNWLVSNFLTEYCVYSSILGQIIEHIHTMEIIYPRKCI